MNSRIKKTVSAFSALTIAISAFSGLALTASAAETVSFTPIERVTDNGDGTYTSAANAGNKYALAIADLTAVNGIDSASTVTISFDSTIPAGSRWNIGIGDASVRGTTANTSSKGTYDTDGLMLRFGTKDGSNYAVNGAGSIDAFGKSVHAEITYDRDASTYSYSLTAGGTIVSSADNVATTVEPSIVEAYSWQGSSTITISSVTVASNSPEPVVARGTASSVPITYGSKYIDYGTGGDENTASASWSANAADVTIKNGKTGIHYSGISTQDRFGYPVNAIVLGKGNSFAKDQILYLLQDAPTVNAMNDSSPRYALVDIEGTKVQSFYDVEDQIYKHLDALYEVEDPINSSNFASIPGMIAKVVITGDGYTVTTGNEGIAKNGTYKWANTGNNIVVDINIVDKNDQTVAIPDSWDDHEGDSKIPASMYGYGLNNDKPNDLLIYTNGAGTIGSVTTNFRIPKCGVKVGTVLGDLNADGTYTGIQTEDGNAYLLSRVNSNGLSKITITADGTAATSDTILKVFALDSKPTPDALLGFVHDYVHQEIGSSGTYSNVKYDEITNPIDIAAGAAEAAYEMEVKLPDGFTDGMKYIYVVAMKKVPVVANPNILNTYTDTAKLVRVDYDYEAKRYANAIKAEYEIMNLEVEDIINDDGTLIANYNAYNTELDNAFDSINTTYQNGKTENVFTETQSAKWDKLRDEKEAMQTIVKKIYDVITDQFAAEADPYAAMIKMMETRFKVGETQTDAAYRALAEQLREDLETINMSWTRASIAGKAYVKDNNYDVFDRAYSALQSFYNAVVEEYTSRIDMIYDTANNASKINQSNYLYSEGRALKYLTDLLAEDTDLNTGDTTSRYEYDLTIADVIKDALDPEEGGLDVKGIVSDLNNVVKTYIPVTKDAFNALYAKFLSDYDEAQKLDHLNGTVTEVRKVVQGATALSALVSDIEASAFADEIKAAIGEDYRDDTYRNKVERYENYRDQEGLLKAAEEYIAKVNDLSKVLGDHQAKGISRETFTTIAQAYYEAAAYRVSLEKYIAKLPETDFVFEANGLTEQVKNAKGVLDNSRLYMQRAAEIITADIRAELDDVDDDPWYDITVTIDDKSATNVAKYLAKAKDAVKDYEGIADTYVKMFLSYSDEDENKYGGYVPYAVDYTFNGDVNNENRTIVRQNNKVDYDAKYQTAKDRIKQYEIDAKAGVDRLYDNNIEVLNTYLSGISFRDIAFDNYQAKLNEMQAVNNEMATYNLVNNLARRDGRSDDGGFNGSVPYKGGKVDSRTDITVKDKEESIITEVDSSHKVSVSKTAVDDLKKMKAFNERYLQFKGIHEKIDALSQADVNLLGAIQALLDEINVKHNSGVHELMEYAVGQSDTQELIDIINDYIINTEPNPTKDVEAKLNDVTAAETAHRQAVTNYNDAYVALKIVLPPTNLADDGYSTGDFATDTIHTVTDYTTGNVNASDNTNVNTAPDYYYDVDPYVYQITLERDAGGNLVKDGSNYKKTKGYYFVKRDEDAWTQRVKPVIETALDARAGYDAASIAALFDKIPDGTIEETNYHEWDDTLIPAHEAYELARQATKDKLANDYAALYQKYDSYWNDYVKVNNDVAQKIAEVTAAAQQKADSIIAQIEELYEKIDNNALGDVKELEDLLNNPLPYTAANVQADLSTIGTIENEIAAAKADPAYIYLRHNFFNDAYNEDVYDPYFWTMESMLDDWNKVIPVVEDGKVIYAAITVEDDTDDKGVKIGYKVTEEDEVDAFIGDYNAIRDHGGSIDETAQRLLNMIYDAVIEKYTAYNYAINQFGNPAFKVPANLNYYNVGTYKNEVETLYDFYHNQLATPSNFNQLVRKVIDTFCDDEILKIDTHYDVLFRERGDCSKSDYDVAIEFNEMAVNSAYDGEALYKEYTSHILANHPKAIPFIDPVAYKTYLEKVGDKDKTDLTNFTQLVKAIDYGSYANPWGDNLVKDAGGLPDENTSETAYQALVTAAKDAYEALSSMAKDAIDAPLQDYEKQAAKAYKLLYVDMPVWHEDFINGYRAAAIASGYASIANSYIGRITEANYTEALAAYEAAVDAIADLDKYEDHNIQKFHCESLDKDIYTNFDTGYEPYHTKSEYMSGVVKGETSYIKSKLVNQLALTAQVIAVEKKINEIPSPVTVDSGDAIAAARAAYDALPADYQAQVNNAIVLTGAESQYAAFDEIVTAKTEAGPVITAISNIGTVTRTAGDAIRAARAGYDALSDLAKTFVSNYDVLTAAEEAYANLEKASGDVNGDGVINPSDINMVLQAILGNTALSDAQKTAADVNQDGKVNVLDLVEIIKLW